MKQITSGKINTLAQYRELNEFLHDAKLDRIVFK